MCALTLSRLDDFFRYSYLYTVIVTIFWVQKLGILGGKLLHLKYPRLYGTLSCSFESWPV